MLRNVPNLCFPLTSIKELQNMASSRTFQSSTAQDESAIAENVERKKTTRIATPDLTDRGFMGTSKLSRWK